MSQSSDNDQRPGWKARAARRRYAQNRRADDLEQQGWLCFPPEKRDQILAALAALDGSRGGE